MTGVTHGSPDDVPTGFTHQYTPQTCPGKPCGEGCDHRGVPPESDRTPGSAPDAVIPHGILAGNPVDGLRLIGPFDSIEVLNEWAEDHLHHAEWWAVRMEAPA